MDEQKQSELMLANDHASVTLSSLVYDPAEDNLLVAALTVASATELLIAIKAHLEKHAKKNWLRVVNLAGIEDTLLVRGAGFGYAVAKSPLRKVNARGTAVASPKACTAASLTPAWYRAIGRRYVIATADQRSAVQTDQNI
jgi:hypothetical protein